jgi:hypothetical protein
MFPLTPFASIAFQAALDNNPIAIITFQIANKVVFLTGSSSFDLVQCHILLNYESWQYFCLILRSDKNT